MKVTKKPAFAGVALISLIAFLLVVGAVFYHFVESLSWLDAFYFTVVTATTEGFGNISPKTAAGKLFTIFFIFVMISMVFTTINHFSRRTRKKGLFRRFFSAPDDEGGGERQPAAGRGRED